MKLKLFVFFFCVFLALTSREPPWADAHVTYDTAQALVDRRAHRGRSAVALQLPQGQEIRGVPARQRGGDDPQLPGLQGGPGGGTVAAGAGGVRAVLAPVVVAADGRRLRPVLPPDAPARPGPALVAVRHLHARPVHADVHLRA